VRRKGDIFRGDKPTLSCEFATVPRQQIFKSPQAVILNLLRLLNQFTSQFTQLQGSNIDVLKAVLIAIILINKYLFINLKNTPTLLLPSDFNFFF